MGITRARLAAFVAALLLASPALAQPVAPQQRTGAGTGALPSGFVRLREVAPTIRQDIRYATPFNFTGRRVPGYEAAECILLRPAAEALARAQARLTAQGYALKVYDCRVGSRRGPGFE
jgi:D-alanyl-D-alanine dipeptidase